MFHHYIIAELQNVTHVLDTHVSSENLKIKTVSNYFYLDKTGKNISYKSHMDQNKLSSIKMLSSYKWIIQVHL